MAVSGILYHDEQGGYERFDYYESYNSVFPKPPPANYAEIFPDCLLPWHLDYIGNKKNE